MNIFGGFIFLNGLFLSIREPEHRRTISRQRKPECIGLFVTLRMYRPVGSAPFHLIVQYQCIVTRLRYANHVVRAFHRCEITYKEKIVLAIRCPSHEAEYASVAIIWVNPAKALRILVKLIACRILAVDM